MKTSASSSVSARAAVPSCVLECLEPRLAPAGVVLVTLSGSTLTLVGDEMPNQMEVTAADGQWLIRSVEGEGTTFRLNGGAEVSELTVMPVANIKATMNGGDDDLTLSLLAVAGTVTYAGNEGIDRIFLSTSSVQGAVKLDGGAGNDDMIFNQLSLAKTLTVKMGAGDDLMSLGFSSLQNLVVDTGAGSDQVIVGGDGLTIQGSLTVKGAGGEGTSSSFTLADSHGIGGKVSYSLASGNATVSLGAGLSSVLNVAGGMSIRTGAGDDVVTFSKEVTILGLLDMNLGAGNNSVTSEEAEVMALGSFKYTGGSGNDHVDLTAPSTAIGGSVTFSPGAGETNRLYFEGNELNLLGKLTYKGGTGGDLLFLAHTRAFLGGAVSFSGGNGSNAVQWEGEVALLASSLTVKGGVDSDNFSVQNVQVAGKLTVNHGTGDSNFTLSGSGVSGSLALTSATAAGGSEEVDIIDSAIGGAVTLKASGEADTGYDVHNNVFGKQFSLSSGGGDDDVQLDFRGGNRLNRFAGAVKIMLGAGDDFFLAGFLPPAANVGNVFESSLSVDGGQGDFDSANLLDGFGNTFASEPVLKGFETVR